MNSVTRRRLEDLFDQILREEISTSRKLMIAQEALRIALPDSRLSELLPREGYGDEMSPNLGTALGNIRSLLPLYEESVSGDLTPQLTSQDLERRIKDEVDRAFRDPSRTALLDKQIEDGVWKGLNDRFTRAPWFQIALAAAAVAITLFTFGLANLNKDVKRADEVVADFQKRLAKADQDLTKDEREMNARLNAAMDNAVTRVSQMQADSMKGLNADLQRRIGEVERAKTDATTTIGSMVQNVTGQASTSSSALVVSSILCKRPHFL